MLKDETFFKKNGFDGKCVTLDEPVRINLESKHQINEIVFIECDDSTMTETIQVFYQDSTDDTNKQVDSTMGTN